MARRGQPSGLQVDFFEQLFRFVAPEEATSIEPGPEAGLVPTGMPPEEGFDLEEIPDLVIVTEPASDVRRPEPEVWRAPRDFELPVHRRDIQAADQQALTTLGAVLAEGRLATSEEKLVLARYTGQSEIAGNALRSRTISSLEGVGQDAEEYLEEKRNAAHAHEQIVIPGMRRGIERFVAFGRANLLLSGCDAPALMSLVASGNEEKLRVAIQTRDPFSAAVSRLIHPGTPVILGPIVENSFPPGYFDIHAGFYSGPRFHEELAHISRALRAGAISLNDLKSHVFATISSSRDLNKFRAAVAIHETMELAGAGRAVDRDRAFVLLSRRSEPPKSEGTWFASQNPGGMFPAEGREEELSVRAANAIELLPERQFFSSAHTEAAGDGRKVRLGKVVVGEDGEVYANHSGTTQRIAFTHEFLKERAKSLIELGELVRLVRSTRRQQNAEDFEKHKRSLEAAYASYVSEYGPILDESNQELFMACPDLSAVTALEALDDEQRPVRSAFFDLALPKAAAAEPIRTPRDALLRVFRTKGQIDLEGVGELLKCSAEAAREALKKDIFHDPVLKRWVFADEYLSGDILAKIDAAEAAARVDPAFRHNVDSLTAARKPKVEIADIDLNPAAPWIPIEEIREFAMALFGSKLDIEKRNGQWYVTGNESVQKSTANRDTFAVTRAGFVVRTGLQIFRSLLASNGLTTVTTKDASGNEFIDETLTLVAAAKSEMIRKEFGEWARKDAKRAAALEAIYDRHINRFVRREVAADTVSFFGMDDSIAPYPHQKEGVARGASGNGLLLNIFPGGGKTFIYAATANERLVRGHNNRICMVVPKNVYLDALGQLVRYFPELNVIPAGPASITKADKLATAKRIMDSDQAVVLVTNETFRDLAVDVNESGLEEHRFRLRELRSELACAARVVDRSRISSQIKKIEKEAMRLAKRAKENAAYTFSEMGFDGLIVDEAHNFRNLDDAGGKRSARAEDLFLKLGVMREENPAMFLMLGTGTVLNRSITEIHTYQRFLQPDILKQMGINTPADWLAMFAKPEATIAARVDGSLVMRPNYTIVNVPELRDCFDQVCYTLTEGDAPFIKRPEVAGGVQIISCKKNESQEDQTDAVLDRIERIQHGEKDPLTGAIRKIEPSEDNMLWVYSTAIHSAIDPRLIDPRALEPPEGKLRTASRLIANHYHASRKDKGTQIVFLDRYRHTDKTTGEVSFDAFARLKEILTAENGLKDEEVVIINHLTEKKREQALKDVRKGDIAVVMGTGSVVGVGVNIQDKMVAGYELDIPWNPVDSMQRRGRIVRQGNANDHVHYYQLVTENSGEAAVASDNARKMASFSKFWKAGRSERAVRDIDEFEASITVLQSELIDPRCGKMLETKRALDGAEVKIAIFEREAEKSAFLQSWISSDLEKTQATRDECLRWRGQFEEAVKATGQPEHKVNTLSLLTIEGKKPETLTEAIKTVAHAARAVERSNRRIRIGDLAGFDLHVESGSLSSQSLLALSREGRNVARFSFHLIDPEQPLFSAFRYLNTGLKRDIEYHENSISSLEMRLSHVRGLAIEISTLKTDRERLKTEYDVILEDLQKHPVESHRRRSKSPEKASPDVTQVAAVPARSVAASVGCEP